MAAEPARHLFVSAEAAGHRITVAKKNLEFDEQDVCLFEPDYTIAGSTGFLIWDGSFLLIDLLKGPLGQLLRGKRVVELGSGTGLAGLCVAAAGAHVLLTDLKSVKEGILDMNITRNANSSRADAGASTSAAAGGAHESGAGQGGATQGPWAGAVAVGDGTAASMSLDWSEPIPPQIARSVNDPSTAEYCVACDVVWLKELLLPLRDVVVALMRGARQRCAAATAATSGAPGAADAGTSAGTAPGSGTGPSTASGCAEMVCLLTFIDRAKPGAASGSFSARSDVVGVFEEAGCVLREFHTSQVLVDSVPHSAAVLEIRLAPL